MVDNGLFMVDNYNIKVDKEGAVNTRKQQGIAVREFILENLPKHPATIVKLTAEHFNITRQAVNKHLKKLILNNAIMREGQTKNCTYKLRLPTQKDKVQSEYLENPLMAKRKKYAIAEGLAEDLVWQQDILPLLQESPKNILNICHYGFTEMFNNAIDHSEGSHIYVELHKSEKAININIVDNGVGIFKKIQKVKHLIDERHALFELHKGKLTTDPKHHTGEGIFFTSRAFDIFDIMSGELTFSHDSSTVHDVLWDQSYRNQNHAGTHIKMRINTDATQELSAIFLDYASEEDDYRFSKTVVPIKLAQYGEETLISRSQAKRILARIELFKTVVLDFEGVENIGQAFADEIFRVLQLEHPKIEFIPIHYNAMIERMILRAKAVNG